MTLSAWRQTQDFVHEFDKLDACTDTEVQDEMCVATTREIYYKDRYTDIKTYKHSRPILVPRASMTTGDQFTNSYINSNFVDGPLGNIGDRKIIASQGPLDNTF